MYFLDQMRPVHAFDYMIVCKQDVKACISPDRPDWIRRSPNGIKKSHASFLNKSHCAARFTSVHAFDYMIVCKQDLKACVSPDTPDWIRRSSNGTKNPMPAFKQISLCCAIHVSEKHSWPEGDRASRHAELVMHTTCRSSVKTHCLGCLGRGCLTLYCEIKRHERGGLGHCSLPGSCTDASCRALWL